MEHVLYRLEKTKIAFDRPQSIDSKLCQPTFNHPKFPTISHFVQYIRDYGSAINYDTAHSKVAYKYFIKVFYNKINKKEYKLQIRQYNIYHTNIIAMKDLVIEKKAREKERLSEGIADSTVTAEMA